jgi:hypothetical protein
MGVVIFKLDSSIGQGINVRGRDWAAMVANIGIALVISQSERILKQLSRNKTEPSMLYQTQIFDKKCI